MTMGKGRIYPFGEVKKMPLIILSFHFDMNAPMKSKGGYSRGAIVPEPVSSRPAIIASAPDKERQIRIEADRKRRCVLCNVSC